MVLHGNTKTDLANTQTWDRIKEHNKIIVCTPAILDQCMSQSYIGMEDISLLIFDEAHHTKKDHPYSRIIRSYYLKCNNDSRPKVFGMTASAVDSKKDIAKEAVELEELLHAKIATTDDGSLLSFAPKPTDQVWAYSRERPYFETDLYRHLSTKVRFCEDLKRGFEFGKVALTQLGPWCADRVWKYVMGDSPNESSSVRRKFEQSTAYINLPTVEEREQALQALDEAALLVQTYDLQRPNPEKSNLSPKVNLLHEKLVAHFAEQPKTRAIVFVNERLKARVLYDCFKLLDIPHLRPGLLMGIAGGTVESTSVKHQEEMLQKFRDGLINLAFATSVADEGLDIPQCNLCIRFDLTTTTIQYMQSRGRARMQNSIFAHMIEEGNFLQLNELKYQQEQELYVKKWCSSLPPNRKLGRGTRLAKLIARDAAGKSFKTSSGAICDSSNSLTIVARFAASLQYTGVRERETYEEEIGAGDNAGQFRYTILLPANDNCKLRSCRGEWKPNKQLAKRSAAWKCCFVLRKEGYLNEHLDSIFKKVKPENLNAHLAVSAKKSAYPMQVKPTAWQTHLDTIPTHVYATVLTFTPERPLKHKLDPLIVLTKSPLPSLPTFTAYLEENIRVEVDSEPITSKLAVSEEELRILTAFTLEGVFSDVFNKVYEHEPEKMSYWLAPRARNVSFNVHYLGDIVDTDALKAMQRERLKWNPGMSADLWTNKFIIDPLNGKFHYFTGEILDGVKITDPIPEGMPKIAQKRTASIIDFSDSTWSAFRKKAAIEQWYDPDQPVLSADLIGTRRNFLDTISEKDLIPCQIAPQTLQIARIDPGFAATCLVWPALIHRIESYMIVLEAFEKLNLPAVTAGLALEAFTKDADNEDEEQQTHTGGRRGMGKNYERLEFIGDSLLKLTTTMTVFNRTTCDEEGMHCRRMEILCNRRLYDVSTSDSLQLYRYARTLAFNRNTWYPEHLKLIYGRGAKKEPTRMYHPEITQDLGMKTIADISEAIIGAAITSTRHLPIHSPNGTSRFDLGIRAITTLVQSPDHDVQSWDQIAAQYKSPAWSLASNDPVANHRVHLIAAKTGYTFKHPRLLRSAFTHSSDMNSPVPDLQRLEFLGDAVLDWVCISWLFNTNPTRNPQWLTEHKMAMVSNKFLAALAVTLDFDQLMFATTAKLIGDITEYARKVRAALAVPNCPKNFWTEIESPPKALSDLVESYLGAVLVDSGFDYAEMEEFFNRHVKHFFENISDYDSFANRHPTTYLYKKLGQEYKCRDYGFPDLGPTEGKIETEIWVGVMVHGRCVASSKGASAKYARVRASKAALQKLEGMTRDEFRRAWKCDCPIRDDE